MVAAVIAAAAGAELAASVVQATGYPAPGVAGVSRRGGRQQRWRWRSCSSWTCSETFFLFLKVLFSLLFFVAAGPLSVLSLVLGDFGALVGKRSGYIEVYVPFML